MHLEYQYLKLMETIIKDGKTKPSRGIHPIRSIFGYQMKFDMRHGFPLMTTKKMPFNILAKEMLWFVSGSSNIKYLQDNKIRYWDEFADKDLNLGPVYGVQWRHWQNPKGGETDQLAWAIDQIKNNPNSKAIIVSAWNPADLAEMRLPPCHTMFHLDVTKGKLRMLLYQRSSDVFLGLPFNIAQYSLLLYMIAHVTGLEARELVVSIGNAHLYTNHIEQAKEQLKRAPMRYPKLKIVGDVSDIDSFAIENFELTDYKSHPHIKAPLVIL